MSREPDRKDDEAKQRLAEALRANLRRRKDQARDRKAEDPQTDAIGVDGDGRELP